MAQQYVLANGWEVEVTKHTLSFKHTNESGSVTRIIGCQRMSLEVSKNATFEAVYSRGGDYFYIPEFSKSHSFWMSVECWPTQEAMEADQRPGIMGKEGVRIERFKTGETVFRRLMSFTFWSVKSDPERKRVSVSDPMVQDYLSLIWGQHREHIDGVNKDISKSGWTVEEVEKAIGAWVERASAPVPVLQKRGKNWWTS